MCACQSCAIAARADGAGTARRDLPVRQVNTQSSFKALSLNTLTGSPSTRSHVWTVGKFGLRPSLEAALKIQRRCSDSVSFSIASLRNLASHTRAERDCRLHALLQYVDTPDQTFFQGNCCVLLRGLQLQGRRNSTLPDKASCIGSNVLAHPKL